MHEVESLSLIAAKGEGEPPLPAAQNVSTGGCTIGVGGILGLVAGTFTVVGGLTAVGIAWVSPMGADNPKTNTVIMMIFIKVPPKIHIVTMFFGADVWHNKKK